MAGRCVTVLAMAGALLAGLAPALGRAQDAAEAFADIDQAFVCPEALASDEERSVALRDFVAAVARAAPDRTIPQVLFYRRQLLMKHGCSQTLRNLDEADAAIRNGEVLKQPWMAFGRSPDFTASIAASNIKPYLDPRYPTERAVEVYVKLAFYTPQPNAKGKVDYDQVVSHQIYYCDVARYALIERDYFLDGKSVFKDEGKPDKASGVDVYERLTVPQDSVNAAGLEQSCGAASRGETI